MTTSAVTTCARHLPQHFNGCVCTADPSLTSEAGDVDLFVAPTEELSTVIAAISEDHDLAGHVLVTGENTASYGDPDGNVYDITTDRAAIGVRVRHTSITAETYPFVGDPTGKSAVRLIKSARDDARDLESFNHAANEWLKTDESSKGHSWVEPEHDPDDGTVTFRGVEISGFTRRPDVHDGPSMQVRFSDDDLTFTIAPGPTGYAAYYRANDTKTPLTHWERDAVDAHVANKMDRGGYVASLAELFHDAARRARHGA